MSLGHGGGHALDGSAVRRGPREADLPPGDGLSGGNRSCNSSTAGSTSAGISPSARSTSSASAGAPGRAIEQRDRSRSCSSGSPDSKASRVIARP